MKNIITGSVTAIAVFASATVAMAQATGTENNATTGSSAGVGPSSGADVKGSTGSMKNETTGSSGSMDMKTDHPAVEGASGGQTDQMGDHHQPTTGAGR